MTLRQLLTDEQGVSPVIGVILMVAITVILAAVAGTFAFELGQDESDTPPQASFNFEGTGTGGEVIVTHEGGDSLDESQVELTDGSNTVSTVWSSSPIESGDESNTITTFSSGTEIDLVWNSPSSDTTQVLAEGTVP